jgi:hypothetical protein
MTETTKTTLTLHANALREKLQNEKQGDCLLMLQGEVAEIAMHNVAMA